MYNNKLKYFRKKQYTTIQNQIHHNKIRTEASQTNINHLFNNQVLKNHQQSIVNQEHQEIQNHSEVLLRNKGYSENKLFQENSKQVQVDKVSESNQVSQQTLRHKNEAIKIYKSPNVFLTSLSPKKVNSSTNLMLQICKKKARNMIIKRNFQNSHQSLNIFKDNKNQGFKGSKLNSTMKSFRKNKFDNTQSQAQINSSKQTSFSKRNREIQQKYDNSLHHNKFNDCSQQDSPTILKRTRIVNRPNFMCNLTLYRKKFRMKLISEQKQKAQQQSMQKQLKQQLNEKNKQSSSLLIPHKKSFQAKFKRRTSQKYLYTNLKNNNTKREYEQYIEMYGTH